MILVWVIKGFFRIFLSKYHIGLNFLLLFLVAELIMLFVQGFILFFKLQLAFFGFFVIFLLFYEYRFSSQDHKTKQLLRAFSSMPFAFFLTNESGDILLSNEVFNLLCTGKNSTFTEVLSNFQTYPEIQSALNEGFSKIRSYGSYSKDIDLLNKKLRIYATLDENSEINSMSNTDYKDNSTKENNNNQSVCFFIADITCGGSDFEQLLAKVINSSNTGIIVCVGSIVVFSNFAANKMFKASLVGKNFDMIIKKPQAQKFFIKQKDGPFLSLTVEQQGKYEIFSVEDENTLTELVQEAPFGVALCSSSLDLISVNRFLSKQKNKIISVKDLVPESEQNQFLGYIKQGVEKNTQVKPGSFHLFSLDSQPVSVHVKRGKNQEIILFLICNPIEQSVAEELSHIKRVFSLGKIVGAVSHDFNNIVAAMISEAQELLSLFTPADTAYSHCAQLNNLSQKAASLIKQIMNTSRKQVLKEEVLDVNESVSEFFATFGRLLKESVKLEIKKSPSAPLIYMNEVNFEQVLINLLLNARDAMPKGGKIVLAVSTTTLQKSLLEDGRYVAAGDYAEVLVSDTGTGITPENLGKIFNRFFTTKKDNGTGFGLSIVKSTVEGAGGFIRVSSKVGVGTEFKAYFPIHKPNEQIKINSFKPIILFVEDEASILSITVKGLRARNYEVHEARTFEEALTVIKEVDKISLIISDIGLPGGSGIDLVNKIRSFRPEIKAILTTGYLDQEVEEGENTIVLQKPYGLAELCSCITKLFDK